MLQNTNDINYMTVCNILSNVTNELFTYNIVDDSFRKNIVEILLNIFSVLTENYKNIIICCDKKYNFLVKNKYIIDNFYLGVFMRKYPENTNIGCNIFLRENKTKELYGLLKEYNVNYENEIKLNFFTLEDVLIFLLSDINIIKLYNTEVIFSYINYFTELLENFYIFFIRVNYDSVNTFKSNILSENTPTINLCLKIYINACLQLLTDDPFDYENFNKDEEFFKNIFKNSYFSRINSKTKYFYNYENIFKNSVININNINKEEEEFLINQSSREKTFLVKTEEGVVKKVEPIITRRYAFIDDE